MIAWTPARAGTRDTRHLRHAGPPVGPNPEASARSGRVAAGRGLPTAPKNVLSSPYIADRSEATRSRAIGVRARQDVSRVVPHPCIRGGLHEYRQSSHTATVPRHQKRHRPPARLGLFVGGSGTLAVAGRFRRHLGPRPTLIDPALDAPLARCAAQQVFRGVRGAQGQTMGERWRRRTTARQLPLPSRSV
jgi:hypothetical protein